MNRVVLDIETLGYPLDTFDEAQQEYLLKFAQTDDEKEVALQRLNLYPATAQIIAIGLLNPDSNNGMVLYQSDEHSTSSSADQTLRYESGTEREIVTQFWSLISKYDQIITFNGRGFDCPFLLIRSMILGIKPSKNLMPYRYEASSHCDLLDQLTFYGAIRKFSLDFYCKAMGIESPKGHGISGLDLGKLFEEKRYREIADYCLGDVKATAELFRRWQMFLHVPS